MKISGKEAYSVMLSDSPDIMNIEEMCSALSISKKTGYKLLREGKIVGMKVGRTYRVPKVHVLSFENCGRKSRKMMHRILAISFMLWYDILVNSGWKRREGGKNNGRRAPARKERNVLCCFELSR